MTTRTLIKTNGMQVPIERQSIKAITALLNADCLDTVNLRRDGLVMIVDDAGQQKQLPVNAHATRLYLSVCRPGVVYQIRGDVVVVPDSDFN